MTGGSSSLPLRITSKVFVKASDSSRSPYILSPSNVDHLIGNIPVQVFTIFPRYPAGNFASVVAAFRSSLPHFLNHFFPLTGRVVADRTSGLLEIHCNNEGCEFVVAHADVRLADVAFHDVTKSLDLIKVPYREEIALSVQVVSFACGGFSIVWGTNHLVLDGYSITMVAKLWTEFVRTNKISRLPNHDRSVFAPRSPPKYSAEIDRLFAERNTDSMINVLSSAIFVRKLYCIEAPDVDRLRELASRDGRKATRLEAVSAYLWKTLARVIGDGDDRCRMMWWVDLRRRLSGKYSSGTMDNYVGNVLTSVTKEASVPDLLQGSYSHIAGMVRGALQEATSNGENHLQELVDWMEEWKERKKGKRMVLRDLLGLGSPILVLTSVHHLRTGVGVDLDFGCGRPGLVIAQLPSSRLARGYVVMDASPKGDGSLVMNAYLWAQVAAALESDRVVKLATPQSLGLVQPEVHPHKVSRL